jgi:mono/diheme cytochrome c family protein
MDKFFISGAIFLAAALWLGSLETESDSADSISRGQILYIAEGCIHCHSQYIRKDTLDTKMWGLPTEWPLVEGKAVLIGNRRQGPDLAKVGTRRSREWNRLHLTNPGTVSPGSRMPSYRHLFEGERLKDGEALLDYLDSLHEANPRAWWQQVVDWSPNVDRDAEKGLPEQVYSRHCAQCHGPDGRGGGVLAFKLARPPRDLVKGPFLFAPDSMGPVDRDRRLAQIVKFGIAGTSMPGHESLTDEEINAVVELLNSVRAPFAEP